MDKELWQRIEQVFYAAMELPEGERDAYVQQTCAGDETLLREVRTLLDVNRRTETFLNAPVERPQPPLGGNSMRMKHCPKCGKTYPAPTRLCEEDREILSLKDPYNLLGSTLADKYKVIALVGVGGMGAVYYARHTGIERRVALKILQPNMAIGNEYIAELFEREAKMAGRLSHPNIVDVTDAGHTADGIAYIVMEWLEGRTLEDELDHEGQFSFTRAIGIVRQIARALNVAHAERIIHRDLKPANIMLVDDADGSDQVKVLDFGIGKILKDTTANSLVSGLVGTPQYASPEQLTVGGYVDGRSDIYSLGVIFFRLLGGELPFNFSSLGELLMMQLNGAPPLLRGIRPETPPEIESLVNRMLAKDPAMRPQSAGELIAALDRIESELDVETPPARAKSLDAKAPRQEPEQTDEFETRVSLAAPKRKSGRWLGVATTLVLTISVAIYGVYLYRSQPDERVAGIQMPSASPTASLPSPEPSPAVSTEPEPSLTPTPDQNQLEINRQRAAERLQRAQTLYKQGDYQNALRECNESLKLNPRSTEARQLKNKITEILKILNAR